MDAQGIEAGRSLNKEVYSLRRLSFWDWMYRVGPVGVWWRSWEMSDVPKDSCERMEDKAEEKGSRTSWGLTKRLPQVEEGRCTMASAFPAGVRATVMGWLFIFSVK